MAKKVKAESFRIGTPVTPEDKNGFFHWYHSGESRTSDIYFKSETVQNLSVQVTTNGMHTVHSKSVPYAELLKRYAKTFFCKDYLKDSVNSQGLQQYILSQSKTFCEADIDAMESAYRNSTNYAEYKTLIEKCENIQPDMIYTLLNQYGEINILISCRNILVKYKELKNAIQGLFDKQELYLVLSTYNSSKCYKAFSTDLSLHFDLSEKRVVKLLCAYKYLGSLDGNEWNFSSENTRG